MAAPLKTFIIYSSKDRDLHDELVNHLQPLVDRKLIRLWSDKEIAPGERWDAAIKRNLQNADIFLMLISVDFYNSSYIREEEFRTAVERLEAGLSLVIPIIVRDCDWKSFPVISELQVLPPGGYAISDSDHWGNRDKAFVTVIKRLRESIEKLHAGIDVAEKVRIASEQSKEIRNILSDIKNERSTLFLGPGIYNIEGMPFDRFIQQKIRQKFPDNFTSYYERDGLFVFKNEVDKNDIRRDVVEIVKSFQPNENILKKIIEIPFSLVISFNPDTYLSNLAYQFGVRHRYSYLDCGYRFEEIESPTIEQPLFYNIAGSVERDDSLILDFDDLFRLLRCLLCERGLSEKLLTQINQTRSFLFVGFRFTYWHSQLLLKALQPSKFARNLASNSELPDKDTLAFLNNQFNINLLSGDRDLLDELYQTCAVEGILRQTIPPGSAEQGDIIRWLQKGEVEKALETLLAVTQNTPSFDEATLLAGQYRSLLREKASLDSRDFFPRQNRIADAILQLTKQLPSR